MENQPTVFHVTHYKAGSQWVESVLRQCAPQRTVKPKPAVAHFLEDPVQPGLIYPTVYVDRPTFVEVLQRNGFSPDQQRQSVRTFVVARDLRDTLVSLYFSQKVSHKVLSDRQAQLRDLLQSMTEEEGLLHILSGALRKYHPLQLTWLDDEDALHIRYEDLIADEQGSFARIIEHCRIEVAPARLRTIVERNSFEAASGRRRGEEDVSAHHRKGVSGDWRNYFTNRVKARFKRIHGDVLIKMGYEADLDW